MSDNPLRRLIRGTSGRSPLRVLGSVVALLLVVPATFYFVSFSPLFALVPGP